MFAVIVKTPGKEENYVLVKNKSFKFPDSMLSALHQECFEKTELGYRLKTAIREHRLWVAETNIKDIRKRIAEMKQASESEYLKSLLINPHPDTKTPTLLFHEWADQEGTRFNPDGPALARFKSKVLTQLVTEAKAKNSETEKAATTKKVGKKRSLPSPPSSIETEVDIESGDEIPSEFNDIFGDASAKTLPGNPRKSASTKPAAPANDPNNPLAGLMASIETMVQETLAKSGINPVALKTRVEVAAQQGINAVRQQAKEAADSAKALKDQSDGLLDQMRKKLENMKPVISKTVIQVEKAPEIEVKSPLHKEFEPIMKTILALQKNGLSEKTNILMVGPSGSGKTTLCSQLAEHLKLDFYAINGSEGIEEANLTQRFLPSKETTGWDMVTQVFAKMVEKGGFFLADELDGFDTNVLVSVHAVLDNGFLPMPDGTTIKRHKDFVFAGTMNTFGTGGNRLYTARRPLDAATRNRFGGRTFWVDYDENLESSIIRDENLRQRLTQIRKKVKENEMEQIISTRDLLIADVLVAANTHSHSEIIDRLTLGWTKDERTLVGLPEENSLLMGV